MSFINNYEPFYAKVLGAVDASVNVTNKDITSDSYKSFNEQDKFSSDSRNLEVRKENYRTMAATKVNNEDYNLLSKSYNKNEDTNTVRNAIDITDIQMLNTDVQNAVTSNVSESVNNCSQMTDVGQEIIIKDIETEGSFELSGVKQTQKVTVNFTCLNAKTISNTVQNLVKANIVNTIANKFDKETLNKVDKNISDKMKSDTEFKSAVSATKYQDLSSKKTSDTTQAASSESESDIQQDSTSKQASTTIQEASAGGGILPFMNVNNYEHFYELKALGAADYSSNTENTTQKSTDTQLTTINRDKQIKSVNENLSEINSEQSTMDDFNNIKRNQTEDHTNMYLKSNNVSNDEKRLSQNVKNVIEKNIQNYFSEKNVSNCINELAQKQSFVLSNIKARKGVSLKDITQDQVTLNTGNCVSKSENIQNMMNEMLTDMNVRVENDTKFKDTVERVEKEDREITAGTRTETSNITEGRQAAAAAAENRLKQEATAANKTTASQKSVSDQSASTDQSASSGGSGNLMSILIIIGVIIVIGVVVFFIIKSRGNKKSTVTTPSISQVSQTVQGSQKVQGAQVSQKVQGAEQAGGYLRHLYSSYMRKNLFN